MRIEKDILKQGYWWLPEKPDDKKVGTLQISDGGEISLDLVGIFNNPLEQNEVTEIHFGINSIDTYERIEGVLEDGEYVVLENCYNEGSSFRIGRGLSKSVIDARFAFVGEAVERIKEIKFSRIIFSVEGLYDWLDDFSGVETVVNWNDEGKKITGGEVHFERPTSLNFELENGYKIFFDISIKPNFTYNLSEVKISQEKLLRIDFQETLELPEIIGIINKVRNFFSFSIDKKLSIKSVKIFVDEIENQSNYVDFYYKSQVTERSEEKFDIHQMLFHFCDISDCFPKILNNWFKYYEILEPTFNLYFSVIYNNPTIQTRFLLIAHALEFFHRKNYEGTSMPVEDFTELSKALLDSVKYNENFQDWVTAKIEHGNELYLAQRINLLIEPFKEFFGSRKTIKSFVFKFCVTRNCLTHFSENSCKDACKGEDLVNLYNKSEALLQLHLLKLIEFPENKFEEVISRGITRKIRQEATFV